MPVDSSWLSSEGLEEPVTLPSLKSTPRKAAYAAKIGDSSDEEEDENKDPNGTIDKVKGIRGGHAANEAIELGVATKKLSLDKPSVFAQVSP